MNRIAFLPFPEFQMLGIVSAIETLRVANSLYETPPFDWVIAYDKDPVIASSSGATLTATRHISDLADCDALIVTSSFRHDDYASPQALNVLRRLDRHGKTLGSFESGIYHLAMAGVMDGHTASAHFNNLPLFAERFPEIRFVKRIFTYSDRRMTCAGGIACVDLMLHHIARRLGQLVAAKVANIINHPFRRDTTTQLDNVFTSAHNGLPGPLRTACREMEAAIDSPLPVPEIAKRVALSRRHLDRLFQQAFGCTSADYYRQIRLSRARKLVKATDLDFTEISARCGFGSYSHFLAHYRAAYAASPTEDRTVMLRAPGDPNRISPANDLHPFQTQLDPRRMI